MAGVPLPARDAAQTAGPLGRVRNASPTISMSVNRPEKLPAIIDSRPLYVDPFMWRKTSDRIVAIESRS